MAILWSNNASSTVSGSITATSTSVALAAGTGVLFPNPTGGDYFCATFYDQATKTQTEIVHCTARSGDTLTIVRAQESTTAQAWSAGDIIANLVTAGTLRAFVQAGTGPANTSLVYVGTDTSTTPNLIIATTNPVPASFATGMLFNILVNNTNTGPVQLQLNGLAAIAATRTDGSPMVGGNIVKSEEMIFVYNGVNFTSMVPPIPQAPPQTTFYVRPDGNDNNDGFANTPQHAFLTISGAMYAIKSRYISNTTIVIRVADGTYVDGVNDYQNYIAEWYIIGNTTNPGNVVIDASPTTIAAYPPHANYGGCVAVDFSAYIVIQGFTFKSYYQNCGVVGGTLDLSYCNFTAPISGATCIETFEAGRISMSGPNSYSGATACAALWGAGDGGTIELGAHNIYGSASMTMTINGTPTFTVATAYAGAAGRLSIDNTVVTFSGGIPNGRQYAADTAGGIVFGSGVTSIFPGTQPGVITPPGWSNA